MEEVWKDVAGYKGLYEISDKGNIRKKGTNHCLQVCANNTTPIVLLYAGNKEKSRHVVSVARLVAEAFVENPFNYPKVYHVDGNTFNNNANNLSWGSQSDIYNVRSSKLTPDAPRAVFSIDDDNNVQCYKSVNECAKANGISTSVLCNRLKKGKAYKGKTFYYEENNNRVELLLAEEKSQWRN